MALFVFSPLQVVVDLLLVEPRQVAISARIMILLVNVRIENEVRRVCIDEYVGILKSRAPARRRESVGRRHSPRVLSYSGHVATSSANDVQGLPNLITSRLRTLRLVLRVIIVVVGRFNAVIDHHDMTRPFLDF